MKSQVVQLRASPATFDGLMDADRQLGQDREPDLILAYLPADDRAASTLAAMAEVWPSSRRLGCETAGQLVDTEISRNGCLHVFWFDDEASGVTVEVIEGSRDAPPQAARLDAACRGVAEASVLLVLADGLRFPVKPLLSELQRRRKSLPPVIAGGLASRPKGGGDAGARVFSGTTIFPSACLLVGLRGVEASLEMARDFEPASPIYTVTRAEDDTVYEIDGEPAVDWYRRFFTLQGQLAPMPRTALAFPLVVAGPDPSRRGLCRSLRTFDEPRGAVTYWGEVQEGDLVRLGMGDEASLVRLARRMVTGQHPEAALLMAFTDRETLLGDAAASELADLSEVLGLTALGGFVTFGEVGSVDDGSTALQNQTAVLLMLEEKVP